MCRAFFGQETGFLIVILSLPKENLKERISIRHNYDEEIIKWLIEVSTVIIITSHHYIMYLSINLIFINLG